MAVTNHAQTTLFDCATTTPDTDNSSTFADNMSLPLHRWFKYSAGFSSIWVQQVIRDKRKTSHYRILDPFAGSGTTLIEASKYNVDSFGVESHPFISRITRTKLLWNSDADEFLSFASHVLRKAEIDPAKPKSHPAIIEKSFSPEALAKLDAILDAWTKMQDDSAASELTWLALASMLRECSAVGTAQWQYILPRTAKAKVAEPFQAFRNRVAMMRNDMLYMSRLDITARVQLFQEDARECPSVPDNSVDLIITSPPYANNYDYADATRLEMCFFGDIEGWGDLQDSVRKHLIRSCSQHVSKLGEQAESMITDPLLSPIRDEFVRAYDALAEERLYHGGKKNYHFMILAYFHDLARVWHSLRRVTVPGGLACFVIGDSAPYGIYVPVDEWLGKLAINAGFESYSFEHIRDRNIKWKNRKHRVPLKEGRLWIRG